MIKTYKFKLYKTKKLKNLHSLINLFAGIYNHCIALHKRYYKQRITPEEIAIADNPAMPDAASTLKSDLSKRQEALPVRAR